MFIWKETGLRGPAYPDSTPYTAPNSSESPRTPRELLQEIDEPQCPAEKLAEFSAHPDWYFVQEQDLAPYCQWIRKPDEMIVQLEAGKKDTKLATFRALREPVINRLNGAADRLARKGDAQVRALADDAIEALLAITDDLPADPELVDAAIMAKYLAIRATLPDSMHKAFAQVDA